MRAAALTVLTLYVPLGFYWYVPFGHEMTQIERQAWFVRGMMSVLVAMLAYQAIPGSRLRGPCIGVAILGLVGAGVALSHPEQQRWGPAAGILQFAVVLGAGLIAFGEAGERTRRLGKALVLGTALGLVWFIWLRAFNVDPGGPELTLGARVLGTEAAPLIPISIYMVLVLWAWRP